MMCAEARPDQLLRLCSEDEISRRIGDVFDVPAAEIAQLGAGLLVATGKGRGVFALFCRRLPRPIRCHGGDSSNSHAAHQKLCFTK